ncbi:MAG: ATP-binding protein [Desulfuromonadales bacterium]|jgi:predicted AAA+ superfamily ATPase
MNIEDIDIDWNYLFERVERLIDLGEEYLGRRLVDFSPDPAIFDQFQAFRWIRMESAGYLQEVEFPDLPELSELFGIDRTLVRLRRNTLQFVKGLPANNVLLWGERGGGKSSSVKGLLREFGSGGLRLVEVQKEDLFQLPVITDRLRELPYRFVLFCDDLSFDESEVSYRELKALLEGGLQARPENVLVYATSNRRHLMPERFEENTGEAEIHPEEAVSEKLSLSDRFGITLGFYPMSEETYLSVVHHLADRRQLAIAPESLSAEAKHWAMARGARSGRVARQFIDDLTGRLALEGQER